MGFVIRLIHDLLFFRHAIAFPCDLLFLTCINTHLKALNSVQFLKDIN
jgi:hypothetical protein